ncbi:MAG: ABC-2 transporter permease [Actinobacteria bacterium]|nr:MAG: ABC-2 transporter permease [Actinomycetota bacterium]
MIKTFLKLIKTNFKMTFRNKQAIAWTFVMPVILMILFGLAFGKERTISMKVAVIDNAKSTFSKEFVKGLKKIDVFRVSEGKKATEIKALKNGDRLAVIVLPGDFGNNAQAYIKASIGKAKAASLTRHPERSAVPAGRQEGSRDSLASPQNDLQSEPKVGASEIQVYYDEANRTMAQTAKMIMNQLVSSMNQKVAKSPKLFKVKEKNISAKKLSTIDFYVAGIIAMFTMQGGVMQVIMILVGYREQGILRRLKATPMSTTQYLGSQILVRILIALLQLALLLGIAIVAFGAQVAGSIWLLTALVIEGSLVFIALGFTLASFARTNQTAMALAQLITLPMMFLAGVFFPTDTFPQLVQPLIKAIPLNYLADGLRLVMMRGSGFSAISYDMFILAIFGTVFFLVSVKAFRWE